VLEARDRVGGRVHSIRRRRGSGSTWAASGPVPTQDRLLGLAKELGVPTFPTYNTGDNVFLRDGARSRYSTAGPLGAVPTDAGAPEAGAAIIALNEMAQTVPATPRGRPRAPRSGTP
jgi:monoamine oxidase